MASKPVGVRCFARKDDDEGFAVEGLEGNGAVTTIDDWIELQGSEETVRLMSYLRGEIRRCIHLKVLDPGGDLPAASQDLVALKVFFNLFMVLFLWLLDEFWIFAFLLWDVWYKKDDPERSPYGFSWISLQESMVLGSF